MTRYIIGCTSASPIFMLRLIAFFSLFFLTVSSGFGQAPNLLQSTEDKENVVSSVLEGKWQNDGAHTLAFKKDESVLMEISGKEDYYGFLKDKVIYFAGRLDWWIKDEQLGTNQPFVLIEDHGNPIVVWFRERNGDPIGDAESFILFIARGNTKAEDVLHQGGDFNNQGFRAFRRLE